MREGATPVLAREELTSNVYDDIRFQRALIEEMGELLSAKLLAECDLSRARSVLEIGCGTGEWLRAVARQYPDLQCIGIDEDELQVKAANALAYRDGLAQVAFLTHEINDLPPHALSRGELRSHPPQLSQSVHPDGGLPRACHDVRCPVSPRRHRVLDRGRIADHHQRRIRAASRARLRGLAAGRAELHSRKYVGMGRACCGALRTDRG